MIGHRRLSAAAALLISQCAALVSRRPLTLSSRVLDHSALVSRRPLTLSSRVLDHAFKSSGSLPRRCGGGGSRAFVSDSAAVWTGRITRPDLLLTRLYSTDDNSGVEQKQLPRNGTGETRNQFDEVNGMTQPSSTESQVEQPVQGDMLASQEHSSGVDVSSLLAINPADIEIVTIEETPKVEEPPPPDIIRQLPFVSMFRGSANYIANHRNTLAVFHIPGGLLDLPDPAVFRDLMNDVALTWLLGIKIVLIVGCRYQIEKRIKQEQADMLHGLRVTDESTLRVVKEEAGFVRFEVERQLARSLRMQGTGSSDGGGGVQGYYDGNVVSGNFYSAQPFGILDGVDYMYTGFVRRVETEKIRKLHENHDICLLTTLGVSPSGEVFNVNSESLAASVAGAFQASKVVYFTEQEMEIRHIPSGNKIQSLRLSDGRNLLKYAGIDVHKKGYVTADPQKAKNYDRPAVNLLLKVGFSIQALELGVKRAHIISPKHGALLQELYTRDGSGTLISGDLYEGIRRATVNDVAKIYDLISPLIIMGKLVDRPKAKLEKDIDKYYVYTRDDAIVACGQLTIFEDGFAEIGCLVVNNNYRSRGRGDAILGYLERVSLMNGCSNIFVLSTQTMEWFGERGFEEVEVDRLPPSRQKTYNYARRSKIYMKKIESSRDLDASELWWNR